VTPSEIIFHRRVRVLEHAAKTSVAEAHRVFGVSRKTIHHWKRLSESYGLEALMPKTRRAPAMPNATPTWVVEELLAEAVVRPTLGAARYAEALETRLCPLAQRCPEALEPVRARPAASTRRRAGAADRSHHRSGDPGRPGGPVRVLSLRGPAPGPPGPGQLLHRQAQGVGPVWQLTAVDTATRWAVCEVFIGPSNAEIATRFVDRTIRKLRRLGVNVTGVCLTTAPSLSARPSPPISPSSAWRITGPRPAPRTTTRSANASKATALQECWRPAFHRRRFDRLTQLRARSTGWLVTYNTRRPNKSDFMRGRTPAKSSTHTATSEQHDHHHTVQLSPQPVARKA